MTRMMWKVQKTKMKTWRKDKPTRTYPSFPPDMIIWLIVRPIPDSLAIFVSFELDACIVRLTSLTHPSQLLSTLSEYRLPLCYRTSFYLE